MSPYRFNVFFKHCYLLFVAQNANYIIAGYNAQLGK